MALGNHAPIAGYSDQAAPVALTNAAPPLHDKLHEVESYVSQAHQLIDELEGVPTGVEESNEYAGAIATANRCSERAATLVGRLSNLRARVGLL